MLPVPDADLHDGLLEILAAMLGAAVFFVFVGILAALLVWLISRYRFYLGRALFASAIPLLWIVGLIYLWTTGTGSEGVN